MLAKYRDMLEGLFSLFAKPPIKKMYLPMRNPDQADWFRNILGDCIADAGISCETAAAYMGYRNPEWLRQVLIRPEPHLIIGERFIYELIHYPKFRRLMPLKRLELYEDQLRTARFFTLEMRKNAPDLRFPVKDAQVQTWVNAAWQGARDYAERTKPSYIANEGCPISISMLEFYISVQKAKLEEMLAHLDMHTTPKLPLPGFPEFTHTNILENVSLENLFIQSPLTNQSLLHTNVFRPLPHLSPPPVTIHVQPMVQPFWMYQWPFVSPFYRPPYPYNPLPHLMPSSLPPVSQGWPFSFDNLTYNRPTDNPTYHGPVLSNTDQPVQPEPQNHSLADRWKPLLKKQKRKKTSRRP